VSDLSWNEEEPWTMASVAEDNILQVRPGLDWPGLSLCGVSRTFALLRLRIHARIPHAHFYTHTHTHTHPQIWSPADSIYNEEEEEEAIGSGAGPRDEDLEA
jgi:hypothetical protein